MIELRLLSALAPPPAACIGLDPDKILNLFLDSL